MVRPGACATVGVAEAVDRLQKAMDIGGEVRNRRFGQAPSSGLKRRFGRPHSIPPISLAIDVWQIQAQRRQPMSTRPHFCWPRAKRLQGQIAVITSVEQPIFGLDLTVTMTVDYTLLDASDGEKIFHKMLTAGYTATVNQSFYGVERLKIANEGAARENIRSLLDQLRLLELPKG